MDPIDLLARENEFKKLNKQLEKKTESLIKEIEDAMQKKDIFADFSTNLTLTPICNEKKRHSCEKNTASSNGFVDTDKKITRQGLNKDKPICNIQNSNLAYKKCTDIVQESSNKYICCTASKNTANEQLEFLYAFVSLKVKENILPQSFMKEKVTVESVCKFMSTKIQLLLEEIENLQASMSKKTKQCELHMAQLTELETVKLDLMTTANAMTSQTADMRAKYAVMQNRVADKDRMYKELRREADQVTAEVKVLRSQRSALEARCAAHEELVTGLRRQLDTAKSAEKDLRESSRSLSSAHLSAVGRLEARVKSLVATVDKQTVLVDNLRRQNALLATETALRTMEKDYNDFLNQDF